jgi:hypothetical protein
MNATGPCITVNIERVSAEDVLGMVRHDMRIASPPKPGLDYGPYPNYVHVDKIKDNVVIKKTTAEEIHKEFDRRLKYKNDHVEGHNELVKERRKQLREEGADEEKIEKEGGKFQRSIEKSAFTHRAYSLVLGLSDDAFNMLGADVPRSTVNEILTTALRTVIKEIGIDEDEMSHVIVHWDETHPHLHAGLPYLNKSGERFQKNFSPAFLSKLIRKVNLDLAKYGMKPPKTYKDRGKRETHKSTKELKKETQRAHEIFLEHSSKAEKAKNEAELAEAEARNAREKLIENQRKNADLNEKLAELARTTAELESGQIELNDAELKITKKEEELRPRESALRVSQEQNKDFEQQIGEDLKKLEEGQEQLKADQLALEQQKANLGQIKKDAMAYRNLREQAIVVLALLKKMPEIIKSVVSKTRLGDGISKLAEMVGMNMSDPEGPKIN